MCVLVYIHTLSLSLPVSLSPHILIYTHTHTHTHTQGSTQDYFKHFVQKHPFGTLTDEQMQVFNNGKTYLYSGTYIYIYIYSL